MKQLTKFLLLALLISVFAGGSVAQKSQSRVRKPSRPAIICTIESVPRGMVVVGYKRNTTCSAGAELLVKQPENADIICAESPLPPQFSITSEAQGDLVGTCPTKAFLISGMSAGAVTASNADDLTIGRAFAGRTSNIQVQGEGTVIRLLDEDLDGSQHQRFIVELASGHTLLISHNIDLAPRINGLEVGDSVRFNGEYVWNAKGGLIHWTHHDPQGRHVGGWLIHNGKTYQ